MPKGWFRYSLQIDYGVVCDCSTMSLSTWETYIWFYPALNLSILDALILIMMTPSKIDDVLFEHGRLLYVLPLAVHPTSLGWTSRGGHSKMFFVFEFVCGTPPSCLKVRGWMVAICHKKKFFSCEGAAQHLHL